MKKSYYICVFVLILLQLLSCDSNKNKVIALNNDKIKTLNINGKDSLSSDSLLKLVKTSYKELNWVNFHKYRLIHINSNYFKKYYKANSKILDYSAAYFWKQNKLDSTFYYYQKAYKSYMSQKDSLKAGKMLLNMAIIQKNTYNFSKSETSSFGALKLLKSSNNKRRISSIYNNLGILYKGLNDFENSIKYHTKAYNLRKQLKNTLLEKHSLNNIGNLFKEKKDYKRAVLHYKKGLAFDSLLNTKAKTKAMLLDNYAFALFLKEDYKELPELFFNSLKIRDSINDIPGLIVSNIHLGRYYKKFSKDKLALNYLETAKKLSKSINYKKEELEAMELLLDFYPQKKAVNTAKKILFTRDSLTTAERKLKESISRIEFETAEKENVILQQEKKLQSIELTNSKRKNIIFIFTTIFSLILLAFVIIKFKNYKQNQKFKNGFSSYLKNKYSLTERNFEFWQKLNEGHTEEELSKILFLSLDGVKSRRKALFSKLKKTKKITGSFDKSKAIILYKKELDLFKKSNK